jgi:hypothetical protein
VSKQQHATIIKDFDKKKGFSAAIPNCKKVTGPPGQNFMRPI